MSEDGQQDEEARFPIVGIGASAGGLHALEELFGRLPNDTGMAFVIITHLHPDHPSLLAELLSRKTAMPVLQISEPTRAQPDHVYTVHPGYALSVVRGVLTPTDASASRHGTPIDYFFRALARDQKERAIAIVLSGTGTDGSIGLEEIKGELGMVMAQDEQSAEYSGMPRSAIATRLVDFVLAPAEMPQQLVKYAQTLSANQPRRSSRGEEPIELLEQILALVQDRTGHDFSQYKTSTISRRAERRMDVHRLENAQRYVRYLQTNPAEVDLLFKELLIGVTSFFRDPDAWTALAAHMSDLLTTKPDDHVLRAWVAGCSTGEEAYSLAILLEEQMVTRNRRLGVQIFATDIDPTAIGVARAGTYPVGIANDVSPERLARFFTKDDGTYCVKQQLREMVVFAPQNLIGDPPFTKLDILACRNLLIYFEPALQKRLLPLFHYSLKPDGILFLGSSESLGSSASLFSASNKKWCRPRCGLIATFA